MKQQVTKTLQTLVTALPIAPRWTIICDRNGTFVERTGEFLSSTAIPLDDGRVAQATADHAINEMNVLHSIGFGHLQYSLSIGSKGGYYIFHLNEAYLLGLGYQDVALPSSDEVINAVLEHLSALLDALYSEVEPQQP